MDTLIRILLYVSIKLNRNVERGRSEKDEFAELFVKIKKLVTETEIKDWYRLIYLTTSIAESAEKYDEALSFYQQLEEAKSRGEKDLDWLDSKFLTSKIAALSDKVAVKVSQNREVALKKIRKDVVYALNFLNQLFGLKLESPPIEILDKSYNNAYWDGKKYNAPPQIQYLPDITYAEIVYPFLEKKVRFNFQGQPGALNISYSRIFASLIRAC